eukprot:jgi/Botrbrau1/19661/Bobra.0003s0025.1
MTDISARYESSACGGLFPFNQPGLEEEYLKHFHRSRRLLDIIGLSVHIHRSRSYWKFNRGYWELNQCFAVVLAAACACAVFPGFGMVRPYVISLFRMTFFLMYLVGYSGFVQFVQAPTFASALHFVAIRAARFKLPFAVALVTPMPLFHGAILTQVFMVSTFMWEGTRECAALSESTDIRNFIQQGTGLHTLWQEQGTASACLHLCEDLLRGSRETGSCRSTCPVLLPIVLTVYGKPGLQSCMLHRFICTVVLAGVLPLFILFWWELLDRWQFAKAKGISLPPWPKLVKQAWAQLTRQAVEYACLFAAVKLLFVF